jgi:hypothetical protein
LSYKVLQLSPQASTCVVRKSITIQDPWCTSATSSREVGFPPSWLDAELDLGECIDRKAVILGLALSTAFSASFWYGVALIVTHILR